MNVPLTDIRLHLIGFRIVKFYCKTELGENNETFLVAAGPRITSAFRNVSHKLVDPLGHLMFSLQTIQFHEFLVASDERVKLCCKLRVLNVVVAELELQCIHSSWRIIRKDNLSNNFWTTS